MRSRGSPFGYDLCQVGVHYLLRCVGKPGGLGCWIEKFPPAEKTAKKNGFHWKINVEIFNTIVVSRKPIRNSVEIR